MCISICQCNFESIAKLMFRHVFRSPRIPKSHLAPASENILRCALSASGDWQFGGGNHTNGNHFSCSADGSPSVFWPHLHLSSTVKAWIFGMVWGGIILVDLMKRLKCKKWLKVGLLYKWFMLVEASFQALTTSPNSKNCAKTLEKHVLHSKKNFTHLHPTHTPLVQVAIEVMATTFTLRFQDILLRLSTSFLDDFRIVLVTNSNRFNFSWGNVVLGGLGVLQRT